MEITWYGLGCFRLTERGCPSLVFDPFDEEEAGLRLPRSGADVVLSSRLIDNPSNVRWPWLDGSAARTLAAPGEYEIGGVFITGVASPRVASDPGITLDNVVYTASYGGVVVCHLGELGRALTSAQVESIGHVDVLLVPVGMEAGLTMAMASETVSLIEPDTVIPMQYATPGLRLPRGTVEGFLKEMGVVSPTCISSLKVVAGEHREETRVLLLEPSVDR
ncbi:MAG: MBL fold metallo-hydrolase [Anaerolineae bacterium]|nr:MBL fold metallo-hydrolase [Anaerolineae bacterium]